MQRPVQSEVFIHNVPAGIKTFDWGYDATLRENSLDPTLSSTKEDQLCRMKGSHPMQGAQILIRVPPSYVELIQNRVSSGKMVPRDRIELSTPAFSGLCSTN